MIDWPSLDGVDRSARFAEGTRVGVLLVQHEANSFAIRPTTLGDFVRHAGDAAAAALAGANSEFTGALAAVGRLGGVPVPLLYALVAMQSAAFAVNNPARAAIVPTASAAAAVESP